MKKIQRFVGNREVFKKLKKLEDDKYLFDMYDTYKSFIANLNIGFFQAEHDDWHQMMNQLVLATKDGMKLLEGDSQDECLTGKLWQLVDGDVDEKLTRYIARTVDHLFSKLPQKEGEGHWVTKRISKHAMVTSFERTKAKR